MKEVITADTAPSAIGPYSQAIKVGQTVYLSGQIPLNPETMQMVSGGVSAETRRVLLNLRAVCIAAGGDLSAIVKLTIYLVEMSDFAEVNEVMQTYFDKPYPARATIAVRALPKGARVEIEGIMQLPA